MESWKFLVKQKAPEIYPPFFWAMGFQFLMFALGIFYRFAIASKYNFSTVYVAYPQLFEPTLGQYGFLQVVRSSKLLFGWERDYAHYLDTLKSPKKAKGFFEFLLENVSYQNDLKVLLSINYVFLTKAHIQGLYLLLSPGPVILNQEAFIPWHLLKSYLVKHRVLKVYFVNVELIFCPLIFFYSTFPEILLSTNTICRMFLAGVLELRAARSDSREAVELYLVLWETIRLFIKYCEIMGIYGADLLAFKQISESIRSLRPSYHDKYISWSTIFPEVHNLFEKHAVDPLEMHKDLTQLCQLGRLYSVFDSIVKLFSTSMGFVCIYYIYRYIVG
jgi:hypothetical protein